jgi:hypothetical protein
VKLLIGAAAAALLFARQKKEEIESGVNMYVSGFPKPTIQNGAVQTKVQLTFDNNTDEDFAIDNAWANLLQDSGDPARPWTHLGNSQPTFEGVTIHKRATTNVSFTVKVPLLNVPSMLLQLVKQKTRYKLDVTAKVGGLLLNTSEELTI